MNKIAIGLLVLLPLLGAATLPQRKATICGNLGPRVPASIVHEATVELTGCVASTAPGLYAVATVGRARYRVPVIDGRYRFPQVPAGAIVTIETADRIPVVAP